MASDIGVVAALAKSARTDAGIGLTGNGSRLIVAPNARPALRLRSEPGCDG